MGESIPPILKFIVKNQLSQGTGDVNVQSKSDEVNGKGAGKSIRLERKYNKTKRINQKEGKEGRREKKSYLTHGIDKLSSINGGLSCS